MNANKVRVFKGYSVSHPHGVINPIAGMPVKHGIDSLYVISLDSGNNTVNLGTGVGTAVIRKAYTKDLMITLDNATGTYSYPTGDGSYSFSHKQGAYSNGPVSAVGNSGIYAGADGRNHTFSMGGI
jgi:hypothetical protein